MDEAGGGDVVDLAWDAAGVVVDEAFGFGLEEPGRGAGAPEAEVDVGGALVFGEGSQVVADADAPDEVGVGGSGEEAAEGFLAAEDDLECGLGVEAGADEEAQVGEGVGGEEVGFVEDEEGGLVGVAGCVEDLEEEAVSAEAGALAEGGDDEAQECGGLDLGEVEVEGLVAVGGEGFDEEAQERGLADAGRPGEQGDGALLGEVAEAGEALGHALVAQQLLAGRAFAEGVCGHFEVVEEHHGFSCSLRTLRSSCAT